MTIITAQRHFKEAEPTAAVEQDPYGNPTPSIAQLIAEAVQTELADRARGYTALSPIDQEGGFPLRVAEIDGDRKAVIWAERAAALKRMFPNVPAVEKFVQELGPDLETERINEACTHCGGELIKILVPQGERGLFKVPFVYCTGCTRGTQLQVF